MWRQAQPLWATCPTAWLPYLEKAFPFILPDSLIAHAVHYLPTYTAVNTFPTSLKPSHRPWVRNPETCQTHAESAVAPLPFLVGQCSQSHLTTTEISHGPAWFVNISPIHGPQVGHRRGMIVWFCDHRPTVTIEDGIYPVSAIPLFLSSLPQKVRTKHGKN